MFERLQAFIQSLAASRTESTFAPGDPRVAFAALCFQVMEADGTVSQEEQRHLHDLLRERYDLDDDKLAELVDAGREAGHEAVDYYRFTSDLNRHLDPDQRVELLGVLWDLVHADGRRSEMEDHVIWRIADLLGVSSRDRVLQRQEAQARSEPEA
nr:TerB family tellurite resistance protein [Rhizobium sp. Q54]